jgi:response regulator RpfG family c-di-GMP phosphodiesterase
MNTEKSTSQNHSRSRAVAHPVVLPREQTIVLYSPDMDFCASFQLLLEDRYHVVTTTDPDMMLLLVKTFGPDLVIADAAPTRYMQRRFNAIKSNHPTVSIMVFYVSYPQNNIQLEMIHGTVDAIFSKPIDLCDVTKRINELVMNHV